MRNKVKQINPPNPTKETNKMKPNKSTPPTKYIDFHSHILPCVDDGSKSIEESISLIKEEITQGASIIVLTPHFFPETDDLANHTKKVNQAYTLLKKEVESQKLDIRLVLGTEVRMSLKLLEMELKPLCIGETNYILVEFSMSQYYSWTRYVISGLQSRGYTPIIAHVERYQNLPENEIYELIKLGALTQVNIGSLIEDRRTKKNVENLIANNLIHLWGTDTHSTKIRPIKMREGIDYLNKKHSKDFMENCILNAEKVLNDESLSISEPKQVKKGWF